MRTILCLTLLIVTGAASLEAQQCTAAQRRAGRCPPPPPPRAMQPAIEFGVRAGYDFDDSGGSAGTQVRIPFGHALALVPSADVYFGSAPTSWQLNADLVARPRALGGLYAGVGAALVNRTFDPFGSSDTRAGFNLLAGLQGARVQETTARPFVEGRWTHVDDYRPFRLAVGIYVPISGGPVR
jgi:hypothetical protein